MPENITIPDGFEDKVYTAPDGRIFYPLSMIVVDHEFNCRGAMSPIDVADLATDIRENGAIQPIVVQAIKDHESNWELNIGKDWRLIAGFRRTLAHKVNSQTHIWGVTHETENEFEARFFNLRENLQRKELSFAQEAQAIAPMVKAKMTRKEICDKLGLKDGWVQTRIMYLQLPEPVQEEIKAGYVSQTQVREVYTAFRKNGDLAAISLTREFKDAKIKGIKGVTHAAARMRGTDRKKARNKHQINALTERLMDAAGSSLTTRCLAWCAGEIKDSELEASMEEFLGDAYTTYEEYANDK